MTRCDCDRCCGVAVPDDDCPDADEREAIEDRRDFEADLRADNAEWDEVLP